MAKRGSTKDDSVRHEDHLAALFNGKRSRSSGAAVHDAGDVRTEYLLIECKMTRGRKPKFVTEFEKVAKEAWEEGKDPMLALRYYDPDSLLADSEGWIDLTLMRASDMADTEALQYITHGH